MLRSSRSVVLSLVVAVALTASTPLFAQSIDPAAATELFRQGRAAMDADDFKTACPKFAESLRLDAKVGTLLNLAECEDKLGQLASARQHLQRAIDQARAENDDRLALAQSRFDAIDKRVPRLTVVLAASAPQDAVVKRGNVALAGASLGAALPVDPGAQIVVVTATGFEQKTFTVTLKEREQQRIEVAPGERLPDAAPAPTQARTPTPTPSPPTTPDAASSRSSLRTWGLVIGGVGIVGVGVGTVLGLIAISKNNASKANGACDANNVCDLQGKNARDDARTDGTISTIAFVAGGVALAAGAVIVLASPSPSSTTSARVEIAPLLGASTGGFALRGAW